MDIFFFRVIITTFQGVIVNFLGIDILSLLILDYNFL